MVSRRAEESFQKGMEALAEGKGVRALALFEAAIEIERRQGATSPQARYLSYYGLCLGLEANHVREGLQFCREAIDLEFYNPDLFLNLGRVLLEAEMRRAAYDAFVKGTRVQPGHAGLSRELRRMGLRRQPVIGCLARRNPLNVLLGRMTTPRFAAPSDETRPPGVRTETVGA